MKHLISALLLLLSTSSHAALIYFEADQSSYQQGEDIQVNMFVSDFSGTLGGFFAELFYDPQLNLQSWQFGNGFDDGLGSMQDWGYASSGYFALSDYTFAFDENLLSHQGNNFMLASFIFTASDTGNFWLDLNSAASGLLSFDNDFVDFSSSALAINISPAAEIPLPATALLLLAGLPLLRLRNSNQV